jgi:dephospho-CoA kinase
VIGLTGNIATGKSTVMEMLSALGAYPIDADALAHDAMRKGTAGHERIVDEFGPGALDAEGEVDRAALGRIVFSDPDALARLEAILHPEVVKRAREIISERTEQAVVVEAIKLLESGLRSLCDAIWVVACRREQQVQRLTERRGLSREEANRRIDAQPAQEAKLAVADVIIDNGGSVESTRRQVEHYWRATFGQVAPAEPPQIRRAGPYDISAVADFLALVSPGGKVPSVESLQERLEGPCWLAIRGDDVVGWAALECQGDVAHVVDLRVDPLEDGQAVMKALLVAAARELIAQGCTRLEVSEALARAPLWWKGGRARTAQNPASETSAAGNGLLKTDAPGRRGIGE